MHCCDLKKFPHLKDHCITYFSVVLCWFFIFWGKKQTNHNLIWGLEWINCISIHFNGKYDLNLWTFGLILGCSDWMLLLEFSRCLIHLKTGIHLFPSGSLCLHLKSKLWPYPHPDIQYLSILVRFVVVLYTTAFSHVAWLTSQNVVIFWLYKPFVE